MHSKDLTGKWVLFQSDFVGGYCDSKPHLVTSHSKNRIYVSELDSEWCHESQQYVFVDTLTPVGYRTVASVSLIFDTQSGAITTAYVSRREYDRWFTEQKREMHQKILQEAIRLGALNKNASKEV